MVLREDLLARIAYWREQERKATPGPWSAMRDWPLEIVPLKQAGWKLGGSVDPGVDSNYAQPLAQIKEAHEKFDGWELFSHRRFNEHENKANAALIVAARNAWPKVLEMAEAEITKHRHIDPWRKHPEALYCEGCLRNVSDGPCPVLLRWYDVIPPIPGGEV